MPFQLPQELRVRSENSIRMTDKAVHNIMKCLLVTFSLSCGMAPAVAALAPSCLSANKTGDDMGYQRIAVEMERSLQDQVLGMWFPRSLDPAGGFYQNYSEDWTRGASNDKALVYQARLIWTAAQSAMRYPAQRLTYSEYVRHGMEFLERGMWDVQDGGFFWGLDPAGNPVRDGEKHAYGISFAIYAACAAYEATHDPGALELARKAFRWLDKRAHDDKNGGYYEALTRRGQPILAPTAGQANDAIGTHYGQKTMNTHIHLLESLTALLDIWPNPTVRKRLQEVFAIVRDKIAVESVGCLNYQFTPEWRTLPDHDSFGHDVETAYLLVEARAALGRPKDPRTWRLARRIVDHALDFGFDGQNAGFYDAGRVFGGPFTTEKIWWVEAEGLNALMLMHVKYRRETTRYWEAFQRLWEFIRDHQVDRTHGGWYATVERDGSAIPGRAKSDAWTDPYHQARALMHVVVALRGLK